MHVAVIIPARNEAEGLNQVLAELPRDLVDRLIVVDNGSTDNTSELARSLGAHVISEPHAGYGRACQAGIAALDDKSEVVVFLDADHSDYPEDLPKLLKPIMRQEADLVIGSRVLNAEKGSLMPQQRFGNKLACTLIRLFFGYRFTDLGPFRAIRRDALERLAMKDETFGWTVEMQTKAARARFQILEVPVRYRRRIGRSKISGTFTGTLRAGVVILMTIVRVAWHFTPAEAQQA